MSEESNDQTFARDEVTFAQLGEIIEALADDLHAVATRAEAKELKREMNNLQDRDWAIDDVQEEYNRRTAAVMIRTLSGLKRFRRNYEYWERAIAEYALKNEGLSQRDAARYLGVAGSTINRWAQNPLKPQEARD